MYTITKNPYNDLPKLHFNYRLAELQEDVERTTSYLGKFRRTEGTAHLLDLIAMTRDESNLFVPFAKEVAIKVFDEFKKGVFNAGDSWYKYKESVVLNDVVLPPSVDINVKEMTYGVIGDDIMIEYIDFSTSDFDKEKYAIELSIEVVYKTKFYMMYDPDIQIVRDKKVKVVIPQEKIEYISDNKFEISSYLIPALLDKETDITSKETIESITSVRIIDCRVFNKEDIQLNIGDAIKVDDELYEITNDTSLNNLNIKKDAVKIDHLDINDGVHFYVDLYSFNQSSAINILDESIKNALSYGVAWKWLMLAYPDEASTYAALYDNAKKEVYSRCSIFNRQHNKVPRIL